MSEKEKITINLDLSNLAYLREIKATYGQPLSFLLNKLVEEKRKLEGPQTGDIVHVPVGIAKKEGV